MIRTRRIRVKDPEKRLGRFLGINVDDFPSADCSLDTTVTSTWRAYRQLRKDLRAVAAGRPLPAQIQAIQEEAETILRASQ